MMKDYRIDGKMQRVFILAESPERVAYISLKTLNRIDYNRLNEISIKNPKNMLEEMRTTTLENGQNALTLYDNIIQVSVLGTGDTATRMKKSDEGGKSVNDNESIAEPASNPSDDAPAPAPKTEQKAPPKPPRRRPGPKPGQKPAVKPKA